MSKKCSTNKWMIIEDFHISDQDNTLEHSGRQRKLFFCHFNINKAETLILNMDPKITFSRC